MKNSLDMGSLSFQCVSTSFEWMKGNQTEREHETKIIKREEELCQNEEAILSLCFPMFPHVSLCFPMFPHLVRGTKWSHAGPLSHCEDTLCILSFFECATAVIVVSRFLIQDSRVGKVSSSTGAIIMIHEGHDPEDRDYDALKVWFTAYIHIHPTLPASVTQSVHITNTHIVLTFFHSWGVSCQSLTRLTLCEFVMFFLFLHLI
jgi:hypothetical protein